MSTPTVTLALRRLPHGQGLALPAYETEGAAGMDLRAAVQELTRLPVEFAKDTTSAEQKEAQAFDKYRRAVDHFVSTGSYLAVTLNLL